MTDKFKKKDEELFKQVMKMQEGDFSSYNEIYALSEKYIYKIINDIVRDSYATEDIMQETYLQIYNKINTLSNPRAFYVWAGRIATNLTLRYIQKNGREVLATVDEEDEDVDYEFVFDRASDDTQKFIPESVLMEKEKCRLIGQIIDSLSIEQKLSVQYFYYEEYSVQEIADMMGVSTGTVKSRLNYARKAIKQATIELRDKHDTKLYSLASVPFLYIVFRTNAEQLVLSGLSAGASATAATQNLGASSAAASGTAPSGAAPAGTYGSSAQGALSANASGAPAANMANASESSVMNVAESQVTGDAFQMGSVSAKVPAGNVASTTRKAASTGRKVVSASTVAKTTATSAGASTVAKVAAVAGIVFIIGGGGGTIANVIVPAETAPIIEETEIEEVTNDGNIMIEMVNEETMDVSENIPEREEIEEYITPIVDSDETDRKSYAFYYESVEPEENEIAVNEQSTMASEGSVESDDLESDSSVFVNEKIPVGRAGGLPTVDQYGNESQSWASSFTLYHPITQEAYTFNSWDEVPDFLREYFYWDDSRDDW